MKQSIRRILGLLGKIVLLLFGVLVIALAGLYFYAKFAERPSGSRPPPGYEDRVKYKEWNTGPSNPNIVPLDIWFGEHNGHYDTTHLKINSDYLREHPHYHGEAAKIMVVWPSMFSLQAYNRRQKQQELPADENRKQLTIILTEANPTGSGDKNGTVPQFRCWPVISDKERGVKYCNEIRNIDNSIERFTNYWPIDESLKTPWYKNSPNARCHVINRKDGSIFDACSIYFSYNADIDVTMLFVPEQLAIQIIADFNRLTNFLSTLEVQP